MNTALGTFGVAILCLLTLGAIRSAFLAAREWRGYRRDLQRAIGYDYGLADGYRRGKADTELLGVLATPTLDDHFGQALLSGALHKPVSEEMKALLGAVQEHERAARAEVAS